MWARTPRALGAGLVLFVLDRDDFGGADRAKNGPAGRPLGECGPLLGIGELRAAVLAPIGELLDRAFLELHRYCPRIRAFSRPNSCSVSAPE